MPTVVAAWTKVIVDYAAERGLDVAPAGLDLSRPDLRVAADVDDAIWSAADKSLGDRDLGIHLAEHGVSAASFGIVGYLVRASANVGEAVARVHQYHRLIKDRGRVELRWSPTGITIIDSPEPERERWPRPIAELIMANYVNLARAWTGVRIVPLEVHFQHTRPKSTAELDRFFACKLRFDQPDNAVMLAHDVLALPFKTAEPILGEYLTSSANDRLAQLGGNQFADEVRIAVADGLRTGDLAIEVIARRLGTTPRSLQRRLRAENISYRELVDAVRHRRALELVQRGVAQDEIADALGFSEPRAFRRAFQRWTGGLLPSAIRGT